MPDFSQPPLDEVAISIQFAPIPGFDVPHFGLYWGRVRQTFPRFEVHPPVQNLTEQLEGNVTTIVQLGFAAAPAPQIRCWFLEESGTRLVQLQRDRFIHNWRKVEGTEEYPRYPALREHVVREWERFCEFLSMEKLERPKVNQCEVVYVNNLEYEKGWSYKELEKAIATLAAPKPTGKFLPDPERVTMQVIYRLEGAGRLYASFVPVIRARDGVEVLQLTLTARGAPKSGSDSDIFGWLDMGRKWVVRGFADFTTETMHQIWGRR